MIHPALQDQDYRLLEPGMPEFYLFSGETLYYQGEACYPIFINEVAYHATTLAYTKTQRYNLDFNHPVILNASSHQ